MKKLTKEEPKPEMVEAPEKSENPKDYALVDPEMMAEKIGAKAKSGDVLMCRTCGKEEPLYRCKCGKYGTKEYMERHVEERHEKGTKAALMSHELAGPDEAWPDDPVDDPVPKKKPKR